MPSAHFSERASVPVVVRALGVAWAGEVRVVVRVPGLVVRVRVARRLRSGMRGALAMGVRVRVAVRVVMVVHVAVGVAVYHVRVAVRVVVHVLVRVAVLVLVFVRVVVPVARAVALRLVAVRVVVGQALAIGHGGPVQRPQPSITRSWRGSEGWKWMSSTPAAGSPARREV